MNLVKEEGHTYWNFMIPSSDLIIELFSSERKMKPPNLDLFNYENAEFPVLLFLLARLFVMPQISNWKISAGMSLW